MTQTDLGDIMLSEKPGTRSRWRDPAHMTCPEWAHPEGRREVALPVSGGGGGSDGCWFGVSFRGEEVF